MRTDLIRNRCYVRTVMNDPQTLTELVKQRQEYLLSSIRRSRSPWGAVAGHAALAVRRSLAALTARPARRASRRTA
jgi:hypothetical protein